MIEDIKKWWKENGIKDVAMRCKDGNIMFGKGICTYGLAVNMFDSFDSANGILRSTGHPSVSIMYNVEEWLKAIR